MSSERKVFILNPDNPKEKIIKDFLDNEYKYGVTVKNILYEYIISNGLNKCNDVTNKLSHHCNSIAQKLQQNDNKVTPKGEKEEKRCNESVIKVQDNYNKKDDDFTIDVDKLKGKSVKKLDKDEVIKKCKNDALDFMKNMG